MENQSNRAKEIADTMADVALSDEDFLKEFNRRFISVLGIESTKTEQRELLKKSFEAGMDYGKAEVIEYNGGGENENPDFNEWTKSNLSSTKSKEVNGQGEKIDWEFSHWTERKENLATLIGIQKNGLKFKAGGIMNGSEILEVYDVEQICNCCNGELDETAIKEVGQCTACFTSKA